jgi:hypothetical protein
VTIKAIAAITRLATVEARIDSPPGIHAFNIVRKTARNVALIVAIPPNQELTNKIAPL